MSHSLDPSLSSSVEEAKKELLSTIEALLRHAMQHGSTALVLIPDDYIDEVNDLIAVVAHRHQEEIARLKEFARSDATTIHRLCGEVSQLQIRLNVAEQQADHYEAKADSLLTGQPQEIDWCVVCAKPEAGWPTCVSCGHRPYGRSADRAERKAIRALRSCP